VELNIGIKRIHDKSFLCTYHAHIRNVVQQQVKAGLAYIISKTEEISELAVLMCSACAFCSLSCGVGAFC